MTKLEGHCHCNKVTWEYLIPIESVTACNCTICRRYGALWAYGILGDEVKFAGKTKHYVRGKAIEYHFCGHCACPTHYIGVRPLEGGKKRVAVNLRMIKQEQLETILELPIDHFDGFDKFDDLPRDDRCVKHLWF